MLPEQTAPPPAASEQDPRPGWATRSSPPTGPGGRGLDEWQPVTDNGYPPAGVDGRTAQHMRAYVLGLVLLDVLVLTATAVALGYALGRPVGFPLLLGSASGTIPLLAVPAFLLAIAWSGGYRRASLLGGPEEYARVAAGCLKGLLLVLVAASITRDNSSLSREGLFGLFLATVLLVPLARFLARRVAYSLRARGYFVRTVLIAGASDQGLDIARELAVSFGRGARVVGFLDDYLAPGTPLAPSLALDPAGKAPLTVLGHPRDVQTTVRRYQVDLLIVLPTALSWESRHLLADEQMGRLSALDVRVAPSELDFTGSQVTPAPLGYIPLVHVRGARPPVWQTLAINLVDRILALALFVVLAPAGACLVVRARARGLSPVVTRRVAGQHGRPVRLTVLNPLCSRDLLLRGWPALLDVVRGDLALAGPRPMSLEQVAHLDGDSQARALLTVRPGLTGPWRLVRAASSPEEERAADLWWVRHWGVSRHLFVLFQSARRYCLSAPRRKIQRWEGEAPRNAAGAEAR